MTDWFELALPLLVTLLWLWGPGLATTASVRLRGPLAWAVAPAVSVGIIAVSAMLGPVLGLAWGPLPPFLMTAAIAATAWCVRALVSRLGSSRSGRHRRPAVEVPAQPSGHSGRRERILEVLGSRNGITVLAVLLGAAVLGRRVVRIIGRPDGISQSFDNIFHLSAVRWMLEHRDGSSLSIAAMTSDPSAPVPFYPAAWHDVVSLVITSGSTTSVPVATNALVIATCAFVWTTGGVVLVRSILPEQLSVLGILSAGALVAAVPMFPFIFLGFGVVYPNLLGFALLPAGLALVLQHVGLAEATPPSTSATCVVGVLLSAGLALSHPNSAMALIAMTIPIVLASAARALLRLRRGQGAQGRSIWLIALPILVIAVAVMSWPVVRPPATALGWEPLMGIDTAIGQGLTLSVVHLSVAWSLSILLAIGVYAAVRHRRPEVLGMWLVGMLLWCAGAAWPVGTERTDLVGVWYNDPFRLAALLGIPTLPVLGIGAAHAIDALLHALPRLTRHRMATSATAAVALVVLTQSSTWIEDLENATHATYVMDEDSMLLTPDEAALLEELPEHVPADALIATSPWDGSSLAYAYTGIRTMNTHPLRWIGDSDYIIDQHLDEAAADPVVCAEVSRRGVTHALAFGGRQVNNAEAEMLGLDDLGTATGFTLIAERGDAKLYRVDICQA